MAELVLDTIQRAKTFQISKWHYRSPDQYNPYKLASQGYECTSLNKLQCYICHNIVSFTTQQGLQRSEHQITKQLQNHQSSCQYFGDKGKNFSKAQLYLRMDQLIQNIKDSYRKQGEKKLFPHLNYKKFLQNLKQQNQLEMLTAILSKSKIDPKQIKISFILIIMGWAKKSLEEIQCAFCGRVVNVKQYKITFDDVQKVQNQNLSVDQSQFFDLFGEHRYFCLWVHQQNGWEIYIQHLYDKLGQAEQLFKNKDPEDIRKIRTLIDGYLQNFKNKINQNFEKASKILTQCSQMAKEIQNSEEQRKNIDNQVLTRHKQMNQFLIDIQSDVRVPLKKVKID